jgi:hypothetical protein
MSSVIKLSVNKLGDIMVSDVMNDIMVSAVMLYAIFQSVIKLSMSHQTREY